jgi:hypothetical protein
MTPDDIATFRRYWEWAKKEANIVPTAPPDVVVEDNGKLEPDFPGMIYIPEGYVAEIMTEAGQSITTVSGIVWVKESRVLMIRKVSE